MGRPPIVPPARSIVGDDEILERRWGFAWTGSPTSDGFLMERFVPKSRSSLLRAEVALRSDPTGVAAELKSVLARVDSRCRISIPSCVRIWSASCSRRFKPPAVQKPGMLLNRPILWLRMKPHARPTRLLQETFRREATLKTLSEQMNALIDEGRYVEADGEVSLKFAEIAGDSITEDSVAGRHFTDQPLALQTYDRDRRYKEMRERNFVDAFSLVSEKQYSVCR